MSLEIFGQKGKGLDFRLRERILPSDLPDPTFLFVVAELGLIIRTEHPEPCPCS